jgi:hypothetical protein
MASTPINIINAPGSTNADTLRTALNKINTNLTAIDSALALKADTKSLPNMFIDANAYTNGSGDAANDTAGLRNALNDSAGTQKKVILTRNFKLNAPVTVPPGAHLEGSTRRMQLIPAAANMANLLVVNQGQSVIQDLTCPGGNGLSSFIGVSKPWDNYAVVIRRITGTNLNYLIRWFDGDMPMFDDFSGINVDLMCYFGNNGMNGFVQNLTNINGHLLYIASEGTVPRFQQMEGTHFHNLKCLQGPLTNNGVATNRHLIDVRAGLALRFNQVMLDQIVHNRGFSIEPPSGKAVNDLTINGLWSGQGEGTQNPTTGLYIGGNSIHVHVNGGFIQNHGYWNAMIETGATAQPQFCKLENLQFRNAFNSGDLYLRGTVYNTIRACTMASKQRYAGSIALYEEPDCVSNSFFDNYLEGTVSPLANSTSRYRDNHGPNAYNNLP